jgi:hypothetical protein
MMTIGLKKNFGRVLIAVSVFIFSSLFLINCGYKPQLNPEGPYWIDDDRQDIPEPESRNPNLIWQTIDRTSFDQIKESIDLERTFSGLFGRPKQAVDINSFDEVPNSSWFTNRIGFENMTPEEIAHGPAVTDGPDQSGPWMVFRPKVQGATPGFWIEDARGNQYIIKFDPDGYPELSTGAAAIGSRYFYVCGYNVPQETIIQWRPEILKIKDGVKFTDRNGTKRLFTEADLKEILDRVHHLPDGSIRSLASLSLGIHGKIKGPFSYSGRRKNDPNDWFRHENRRELRGLYVIASLVNHYDAKDQNSLDIYTEENGRHFLKHYLIDFGSTLGSDGNGPKPPIKGYANFFDPLDIFVSTATLGIKVWPWEHATDPVYRSIGYFESEIFNPGKFDPIYPNPAFENMTDRDAYWGAKIVMAFRDEDLKALVKTGQYSNPEAEQYLLNTLIERRDKIGRYWFGKINPLDNFETELLTDGYYIEFEDLAVRYNLEPDNAIYRYRVRYANDELIENRKIHTSAIKLALDDLSTLKNAFDSQSGDKSSEHLFEILIETSRDGNDWSKPTRLWLWYNPEQDNFNLVGVEHLD